MGSLPNAAVEELNQIVRVSEQFQRGEAASRLLKIPTGDGWHWYFTRVRKRLHNVRSKSVAPSKSIRAYNFGWESIADPFAAWSMSTNGPISLAPVLTWLSG